MGVSCNMLPNKGSLRLSASLGIVQLDSTPSRYAPFGTSGKSTTRVTTPKIFAKLLSSGKGVHKEIRSH